MFNKSETYTEEQVLDLVQLYNQMKFQFLLNKSLGQALLTRLNYGDQLTEQEVNELSVFVKMSETMDTIEQILLGSSVANIIERCRLARSNAEKGIEEWIAIWEQLQPIYNTYLEVAAERGLR